MRLLLDTHTFMWAFDGSASLSATAGAAISDPANQLLLSGASVWEIAIKVGLGKLRLTDPYELYMTLALADLDVELLPITVQSAAIQVTLPLHHRDPFDRMIVAHAVEQRIDVVSADVMFDSYPVTRLW